MDGELVLTKSAAEASWPGTASEFPLTWSGSARAETEEGWSMCPRRLPLTRATARRRHLTHLFTPANGKVTAHREYADTEAIARAFEG